MTSCTAGMLPLYGMWVSFTPATSWKSSPVMWVEEPEPAEPKLISPGLALAIATKSWTVLAGKAGFTTSARGRSTATRIGCRSFAGSYGSFAYSACAAWMPMVPRSSV